MTKQAHRHRSGDLRKKRQGRHGQTGLGASTATPGGVSLAVMSTPRGKGIPVVIHGRTLSDIARALELDQSYLSKLSRGKGTPSLKVARALQAYLGLRTMEQALEALMEAGQAEEGGG